jgi:ABC-type transport system substrate-binding protein
VRAVKSLIESHTACINGLLVLVALLCVGIQVAMAEDNEMTIAVGTTDGIDAIKNFGTDPTLAEAQFPDGGGWQDYHIYTHMSPLITMDKNANIIPWMAESYEVSDDYKTITFHLREGLKFADGTPFNASIAKFNFDRILTYGWKEKYRGESEVKYYDYSEALDDYTFVMHFNQCSLDMDVTLARIYIYGSFISPLDVDPVWDIKGTLKPEKRYNGLGPYYLDENESIPKEKVVLKKRNSWRDDLDFHKPKLDKITLTKISYQQVAVMALENEEVDYICRYWNPAPDVLPELENNPKIAIKTNPSTKMYFLTTAYWKEPFEGEDGIILRKAICYALNRTEIADGAFYGYATPANDSMGISPQRIDAPKCCNKGYDFDIEKAKHLLSEEGWKDVDGDGILDKNGKTMRSFDLVIKSDNPWQKDVAQIVQSQLKEIGIDIKIRIVDYAGWSELAKTGDYDLRVVYNQARSHPLSFLIFYFSQKTTYGNINYYENQNKTLESITINARNAISEEERDRYLCQICDILYEDAGVIPLVYEMEYALMNNKVKGFEFGPSSNVYEHDHLEECWIEN